MGSLGDPEKVPALLALLAPGFLILWVRSRVVEGPTLEFTQQLFYFAVVSAAYYGLIGPLFHVESGPQLPKWLWSLLFYFIVPAVIAVVVGLITERDWEYAWAENIGVHLSHRIPTAWDFRFSRLSEDSFILVTLKDGTTIAGKYVRGSFAASAKDGRDLYLAQIWTIPDTGDWEKLEPERGLLICGDDIRFIEVFGET